MDSPKLSWATDSAVCFDVRTDIPSTMEQNGRNSHGSDMQRTQELGVSHDFPPEESVSLGVSINGEPLHGQMPVKTLLTEAHNFYNHGQFERCAQINEFIHNHRDNQNQANLLLLGACKFMQRDFDASLYYSSLAVDLNPEFAEAYGNIGK